ncbi:GyrI-like domain-containing protein [Microbacterium sp. 2RAF4]|uniref:GyrI-like domain-containing protein n=1 Tax=Microbacterium sp. 2RAF4 TaxID=3232999 RepID=UPI003F9A41AA
MNAFRDAPFGPADRLDLEPVPLAVIRHEGIRLSDLSEAFDAGYSAIALTFAGDVLVPTGPALAVYHGNPMGVFDLELGFPVQSAPANPIPTASGRVIVASTLPSGPAVATTLFGSYEELGGAWAALVERASAQGLRPGGIWIEVYVSDPSAPAAELRTDLIMPIG